MPVDKSRLSTDPYFEPNTSEYKRRTGDLQTLEGICIVNKIWCIMNATIWFLYGTIIILVELAVVGVIIGAFVLILYLSVQQVMESLPGRSRNGYTRI